MKFRLLVFLIFPAKYFFDKQLLTPRTFSASGAEPSIQAAINVTRRGGTYVQGGMGKADINFPIMELCTKEITAKGSFRYGSGDYSLAVELVRTGKVDVKKLITGEVQFEDAEQAFKSVKEGKGIKVLIKGPNEN